MHRRRQVRREVERRVHEREVRECLGEVAEQPSSLRVVLLCEQAEIVRQTDEAAEELVRVGVPAEQLVAVHEPERAGQEDALARWQTVDVRVLLVGAVALDEAAADEVLLDGARPVPASRRTG
jgi:hypothetical protein